MVFLVLPEPSPRSSLSIKDVKDPKPLDTQEKLTLTHIVCRRESCLSSLQIHHYATFKVQLNLFILHEFLIYSSYCQHHNLSLSFITVLCDFCI